MTANLPQHSQNLASDPGTSAWVSANAGSGKTRVLTDRVIRLLIRGVVPENILCLTYTKAAAAEMQNRLFQTLGAWTLLPEAELRRALSTLDESGQSAEALARARTLFARALETPGGLRIQTIHSFCASLLRRFPLESGVTPGFSEMDEAQSAMLMREVLDAIADSPAAETITVLARLQQDDSLIRVLGQIVALRGLFSAPLNEASLWAGSGLAPGATEADVPPACLVPQDSDLIRNWIAATLAHGTEKARSDIAGLAALDPDRFDLDLVNAASALLLTKERALRKSLVVKGVAIALGAEMDALADLAARLIAALDLIQLVRQNREAVRLHAFGHRFVTLFEARKAEAGMLDFADLVTRATALLADEAVAPWVLYRLDGRLEHILVDEAQDTSREQWQLVRLLTNELLAGDGSRAAGQRTIFVVGDTKQSIYSFQGASPAAFEENLDHYRQALGRIAASFHIGSLDYSFRSAPAILNFVDRVFAAYDPARFPAQAHLPVRDNLPGRVDLWPLLEDHEKSDDRKWFKVDAIHALRNQTAALGANIADFIAGAIGREQIVDKTGTTRPVQAGDFLILVRRRKGTFREIFRACKQRGLPIAGADRVELMDELAVKDLVSLLSFLSLPQDDLALAEALRSPLLAISEEDLFHLTHYRAEGESLWRALQGAAAHHPVALEMLTDLLSLAEYLPPYEILERILIRHHGRARLVARLGEEADEGIDGLLAQALRYEAIGTPSLTGFVLWLRSGDAELKRMAEEAGTLIRVMTVHGSKGLEAPIVILPDLFQELRSEGAQALFDDGAVAFWGSPKDDAPPRERQLRDLQKAAHQDERLRLLYVAMTRAQRWLVICGIAPKRDGSAEDWHEPVAAAMDGFDTVAHDAGFATIRRYQPDGWPERVASVPAEAPGKAVPPGWLGTPPPPGPEPAFALVRPSMAAAPPVGAAGAPGMDAGRAALRGTYLHRLLEVLPRHEPDHWRDLAAQIATEILADPADAAMAEDWSQEALGLLADPALAHVFAPESLAEVPFAARLPDLPGRHVTGILDRLVFGPGRVMVVDYKSHADVPDSPDKVPQDILVQMSLYLAAMGTIFAGQGISVAILWTRTGKLMILPNEIVRSATAALPDLDVSGGRS